MTSKTIWINVDDGRKVAIRLDEMPFPDIPFEVPEKPEPAANIAFRRAMIDAGESPTAARELFLRGSNENSDTRVIFENAGAFLSLETLYTFPERDTEGTTSRLDEQWETIPRNAMAVRNRRLMVQRLVTQLVAKAAETKKTIVEVASVGCGSSRPVLEALRSATVPFRIRLVDLSKDALEFSKRLAKQMGISNVETILGSSTNLLHKENGNKGLIHKPTADIIEMVGLLDYFLPMTAVKLLRTTRRAIFPGGHLLVCNIVPNDEMEFMKNGIKWEMFYRTPSQLAEIIYEAGFPAENITLMTEPLGIHCLALCRVP